MAQYGPLDDEYEYPWLNPDVSGSTQRGVLGTPNVSWDGTRFIRNENGLANSNIWGRNGMLPTVFQGLSAVGGLMQAYTGLKQLQFAREQLDASKNAFRTQFEANRTALADSARNAASTNYAAHHGLARSFNQDEQRQVADNEYNRVRDSYKSYV